MFTPAQGTSKQLNNSAGYAMLLMDGLKLLIPQDQIKAMESTKDIEISKASDQNQVVGYMEFEKRFWPVFSFSNNLTPLASASLDRQFCILLQAGTRSFGILSEQALLLHPGEIQPQSLPESMLMKESPITGLAIFAGEVISISSAEHLAALVPLSNEAYNPNNPTLHK